MKKYHWILLILLITAFAYVTIHERNKPFQKGGGRIFGTTYSVIYQHDKPLDDEIIAELMAIDGALSMFNDTSTISRINRDEDVEVDNRTMDVLKLAMEISADTDGDFDITVAPLVNAWGFGFKHEQWPTQQSIDSIMQGVGYGQLQIKGNRLIKSNKKVMLDCSAIAKGYASDRIAMLFMHHDIRNFMVEIGGEIVARGNNQNDTPWHIGVSKPIEDSLTISQELQAMLEISDRAMATSGNYRNFYYKGGQRYAHTIDPHTGRPVQHTLLSATVVAPSCAKADAYATAFMVMGMEKAKAVLDKHRELEAYFIYSDKDGSLKTYCTTTMKKWIKE